ncbi:MAG TPA: cellulose synthase [Ramlibacter sp.]|nr:cellulose synthase [Ramlibacter sp.]
MHTVSARRFAGVFFLAAGPAFAQQAAVNAVSVADAFRKLNADTSITRTVTLAELGIAPIVLGSSDTTREISLPVPPNVPLANATLQMDASFVRADGGRTTLILSLDGYAASARPVTAERGDGSITLAVDGSPRPNGMVRFNVDWRTAVTRENACSDTRTPGNLLRIEPTTRMSYRFDTAALQDIPSAWAALPATPVVLITSNQLSAQAYDAAWRVGVALERAGKHPRIRVLPAVGDTVDVANIAVPAVLKHVPAFAAIADGGRRKIRDIAEVGALVALGAAGPVQADIVIGDRSAPGLLKQALDALRAQLPPEGLDAFDQWRDRALDGWARQLAAGQVRVATVFGRPAVVVAQDAGPDAAALFAQAAQQPGSAPINVVSGDDPRADLAAISLKYLGAKPATLDVLTRGDWTMGFPIDAVSGDGRSPSALVIDVAAAPGAARYSPVASVFLNDVLIAARELDATGRRERIVAPIPRYALGAQNQVRVSFVRQSASDRCRELPEAYPVSVLASSHMLLDKSDPGPDFSGLITRLSSGASLLVPVAYLHDAQATLPRVISLAASVGLPAARTRFDALGDDGPQKIKGPFLALDIALKDVDSEVRIEAGHLFAQGSGRPLLDVGGLPRAGIVEVVKQGSSWGALYRTLGSRGPSPEHALQLSQGNVAVISGDSLRAQINTWDPTGQSLIGDKARVPMAPHHLWMLWAVLVVLLAAAAAYGAWFWRRRMESKRT